MNALLSIILPVFIVIGFGYVARWHNWISDAQVDGLMKFAQGFAIPMLLFQAISTLDLGQSFDLPLLSSYYLGALICFGIGMIGARVLFDRGWEDATAIGMCCLYPNSLLLGLPITERAYGADALGGNFAIIAIHSPFCYFIGITVMEVVRARGSNLAHLPGKVLDAMFHNAIIIGIALGFFVNITGMPLPNALTEALDLVARAALPAALFGLGGVLFLYRPEGDLKTILFTVAVSLTIHPLAIWGLSSVTNLTDAGLRSAILTGAMAPGINAYLFANMYGAARRVAASAVLIGTAASIFTTSIWLMLLP